MSSIYGSASAANVMFDKNNPGVAFSGNGLVQQCTGFNFSYAGAFGGDIYLRACKITAASSMTVTTLSCNCETEEGSVTLALYSDNSNSPNVRLGYTLSTAVVAGNNNVDMISSVAITDTVSYWVSVQTTASYLQTKLGQPDDTLKYRVFTYGTPPNPFGTSSGSTSGVQVCFSGS